MSRVPPAAADAGRATASGRLEPVRLYLREMYPPVPRFVLAAIYFYSVYLALAAYHGEPVALLAPVPLAGAFTYFFFLLFLRLSDEIKDRRADRTHFPDRPVPSGAVPPGWLWGMWGGSLAVLVVLQIPAGGWNPAFLVLLGYGLLMFRYFFLARWIAPSLVLAVVTHNPVGFLLHVYGIWLFSEMAGVAPLQSFHLGVAFLMWIPALVWEVARKIRAPAEETSYQTYSSLFGPGPAAGLAALGAFAFALVALLLAGPVGLGAMGRIAVGAAALGFGWMCLRFALRPSPERARLRGPAELWLLVSLAFWCLDLLLTHGDLWSLT